MLDFIIYSAAWGLGRFIENLIWVILFGGVAGIVALCGWIWSSITKLFR